MNKNIRDIVVLCLLAFGIFLIPMAINYSFVDTRTNTFFKRVDEDFDDCVKDANEDPSDIRLCKEIKSSSELSFKSAKSVSDSYSNISITQTVLFILAFSVFNLRRIEVLEKK